jgi:hypothetical protein
METLVPILQLAIGPVILISGVGLLLLSMTNRLGRIVDRAHALAHGLPRQEGPERAAVEAQLDILSRRGAVMRRSILYAVLSVLSAAVLVITIFIAALLHREAAVVAIALFIACMGMLIASLLAFLRDVNLSLAAVTIDVETSRRAG